MSSWGSWEQCLKLTVEKPVWDLLKTGERSEEIRRRSKWMASRLVDKKTGGSGFMRLYWWLGALV